MGLASRLAPLPRAEAQRHGRPPPVAREASEGRYAEAPLGEDQRLILWFSCARIRCITLMILREFVSTMATNSSTAT
jgi:hypothetical protein